MPPHDLPWLSAFLDPEAYVRVIQWSSITVTALTGVYEARKRDLDFLGVLVIAFVSAVGGGTLRDLLLDIHPIFWIQDPIHLITIAVVSAVGTVALVAAERREEGTARRGVWSRAEKLLRPVSKALHRPPLWVTALDALGLGLFSALGCYYALAAHASVVAAPVLGVITAVFGGFLRDLFLAQIPAILRRTQLYAVCSLAGSVVYVALRVLAAPERVAMAACLVVAFTLRMLAVRLDLKLPV
jgi:uncharacterized membrane protein YeiH